MGLLSDFLSANIDIAKRQLFLWDQYSFKHLPAEVISAIYENFIQANAERDGKGREKGVVYTPIHLVNFLVDEVMPLDHPHKSFKEKGIYKILDPTCGSGVFLVAAYKRLLQWWAVENYIKSGKVEYPNKEVAQKILEDNIFGVDVKDTAVLVSIFGLTTALLDHLTPTEVWGNLKFKDLRKQNIVLGCQPTGFFQWALESKKENQRFSLIIGNPPFNSEKGVPKDTVLDNEVITSLGLKHKNIPRNNFALHFFEASMLLADKVCMIIPSKALLYDKSANAYRKDLFTDFTISDIYDFTHLRESLFVKKGAGKKTGRTPVVALFAKNTPSNYKKINHVVIKRTVSLEQKIRFEIDDYDRHQVKWDWAVDPTKQHVWKTNLLGGGRLFHLVYQLNILPTLGEYIRSREISDGWKFNIGYIVGNPSQIKKANYITNQDYILKIKDGVLETKIEKSQTFEARREEKLYLPPFLLIKDIIGGSKIPVHLVKSYKNKFLCFRRNYFGISVPSNDFNKIEHIHHCFNNYFSQTYQAHIYLNSASVVIKQETYINKEDIESLPFEEEKDFINLSISEKILQDDLLKYNIHLGKSITKKRDGAILHQPVEERQLSEYGTVLCSELNDIYAKNDNSWQLGKIYRMPSYTVYQIGFGKKGKLIHEFLNNLDLNISTLINDDISNRGAAYKRIVRLYQHIEGFDCVYLIKPNALRYWLKSIALRDADETFADFKNGDY